MKILYFDCFAGLSGDMAVAAMINLGVPFDSLKLGIESIELSSQKILKKGISAVKFDVFDKSSHKHADHSSYHIENIEKIISEAKISEAIKNSALKIFDALAEAEAVVHGINPKSEISATLHLHEVGALDSIADIICMSVCIDYLKPDKIVFSSINTGEGTVKCAHGILPVPAPATLELLKNIPVYSNGIKMELTTPTGAAFAKVFADEFGSLPEGKIIKTGYGAGARELDDRPNVLRALMIETENQKAKRSNTVYQIETQIDDMTPETLAPVFEILLENGALDVYITQVLMKKQRAAFLLTVLAKANDKENLEKIILRETTTFGVRSWKVNRKILERKIETFESSLGPIKIKTGKFEDIIKKIPEFDDCLKISKKQKIPVWKIYNKVIGELNFVK